ncbi:YcnI family protein [Williamsia sp. CHRR-6]|uniref:YcnI family copper-binding membrane protein n=1 Tax=Williamsia sp. CHRR-6 TaxID=2835871 RepID=UPI001BDAE5A3|nr:YcnI family protein [Williamsia sp. CHRR-6]MBT0567843.1 YcnI family protein [Williamsia sp. CHRR-6]
MKRWFTRLIAVTAVPVAALTFSAGAAAAHVHVDGTDATQGGYGVLTFRVPTESDTASTTGLTITLPDDTPIISVSVQPKAGWTSELVKKNLPTPQKDDDGGEISQYVSQIVWKATGPGAPIPPGGFDTFAVSAGPLPKADSIALPALQTYSDGKTVNWNQKTAQGQPEPDNPAPVLSIDEASDDHGAGHDHSSMGAASTSEKSDSASSNNSSDSDNGPSWPGVVGLVVAVIALLLGVANLAVARRKN